MGKLGKITVFDESIRDRVAELLREGNNYAIGSHRRPVITQVSYKFFPNNRTVPKTTQCHFPPDKEARAWLLRVACCPGLSSDPVVSKAGMVLFEL